PPDRKTDEEEYDQAEQARKPQGRIPEERLHLPAAVIGKSAHLRFRHPVVVLQRLASFRMDDPGPERNERKEPGPLQRLDAEISKHAARWHGIGEQVPASSGTHDGDATDPDPPSPSPERSRPARRMHEPARERDERVPNSPKQSQNSPEQSHGIPPAKRRVSR